MMEMKRLQNAPLRDARMIAVYNSVEALAERFVEVGPIPSDGGADAHGVTTGCSGQEIRRE
jgi:hypothetical protein